MISNPCPNCRQPLYGTLGVPWLCSRCRVTLEDFARQLAELRAARGAVSPVR